MQLKWKKMHPDAKAPTYGTAGSACVDLYSLDTCVVASRHAAVFDTGIAFEIPAGYAMLVFSRSGDGFKRNLRLANCVGVIDADYRGEVRIALHNDGLRPQTYRAGERLAQAMLVQVPHLELIEVGEELTPTERGAGGFGSTGA